jgi:hypothetical protein
MSKKPLFTDQEANEIKQVYWKFTGRNIYQEPNPVEKMTQVQATLRKYLKTKLDQVKIIG